MSFPTKDDVEQAVQRGIQGLDPKFASMDQRFNEVDKRFNEVDRHLG